MQNKQNTHNNVSGRNYMKYKLVKQGIFSLAASVVMVATTPCNVQAYAYTDDPANTTNETIFDEDCDSFYESAWINGWNGENDWKELLEPKYSTNEYEMYSYESISTEDLFFVRINGETYLATKLVDTNASNIISKYYAIDTGEFLGQTLDINWYARAFKQAKTMFKYGKKDAKKRFDMNVSETLQDQNYFNGEYGLGKNLPISAIIKVSDIFSNKSLSEKQIASLLNYDPIYLATFIDKYKYNEFLFRTKEDYTMSKFYYYYHDHPSNMLFPSTWGLEYCTVLYRMKTSSYIAEKKQEFNFQTDDGTKTIVGYRASDNPKDSGYYYLYDIESSNIIDLSNYYKLKNCSLMVSNTIHDIRNSIEKPMNRGYNIDELLVLGTKNLEGDNAFEDYYIITRENYKEGMEEAVYFTSVAESKSDSIMGKYDLSKITIMKDDYYKCTPKSQTVWDVSTLKNCLKDNNMDFLIKDTYSEQELSMLIEKFRKQDLKLFGKYIQAETTTLFKTVKLEDIIVVDTTKYNEDDYLVNSIDHMLIKNTDTRYFILTPLEMQGYIPNIKYYDTWEHNTKVAAAVAPMGVRIDTLNGVLFYILNADGIQCISPLSDVLNELGLSELIQEEYIIGELGDVQSQLNKIDLKVKEKN